MDIGNRIKKIRGKESQTDFGTRLGKSRNTIMRYETNERTPDSDFLLNLYSNFNIEPTWVLTGEGPIHKSTQAAPAKAHGVLTTGPDAMPSDNLGLGESVELLAKIYNSGSPVLIRAIAANLHAFSEAIDNKALAIDMKKRMMEMEKRMTAMEKNLAEAANTPKQAANG